MSDYTLDEFITRFTLQQPAPPKPLRDVRQAAVLLPVVCHPEPTLLLTRRADTLRKHAGQVAFPGGSADPDDASLIATALREAHEEVGIPPASVRVLGMLGPVESSTGFQVTPVVGLIPPDTLLVPNAEEVADIFEMPLQEALRLSRYTPLEIERRGIRHRIYLSWYQHQFVWGMTAGIIRELSRHVARPEESASMNPSLTAG
ncbi:CoA pyrophosphatase [Chimaeribacter arupi]|uniref:CoA pyrophosphatase n=2 Tax=Yersiniaceae TaxID=1903411 RepID=A0A2N5ET81_9GAMM|nr:MULTISPECIES: CoA pyrophosphatase [Yersiniaceae]MBS0969965.1 CoA pyrophosphatase [Nissabacter archeti]PLR40008.1 CoA pyrophosphatase [Chimaeribacter arupi]PLR49587.1 CoA pyrophosphatase [Chimaeribacter arupi]PLR53283.1 CoA pyrophosphatase [Chimaeribacter arupi]WKZ90975.1 CoA pyrophosphatase [Chimaeribacter arupi]